MTSYIILSVLRPVSVLPHGHSRHKDITTYPYVPKYLSCVLRRMKGWNNFSYSITARSYFCLNADES